MTVESIINTQDQSCLHIGVLKQKHLEIAVLQVQFFYWFVLNLFLSISVGSGAILLS